MFGANQENNNSSSKNGKDESTFKPASWLSMERFLEAFRELRLELAPQITAAQWANIIGTSPATLSRIENGKTEAAALVASKMSLGVGFRTSDMLNLSDNGSLARLKAQHRPLFRLPNQIVPYVEDPKEMRRQFASWNSYQTLKEDYYGQLNFRIRSKMMAEIGRLIAEVEHEAKLKYTEYRIAPGLAGIEADLTDPQTNKIVEKFELGEVLDTLGQITRSPNVRIVEATNISGPMLSRLQRNEVEPMLTTVDRLAGFFGLTFDELIWLKYPTQTRWIFFIEDREVYQEAENATWFSSEAAIEKFKNGDIQRRVEMMLEYHKWWDRENDPHTAQAGKRKVRTPILEVLKLRKSANF